MVNHLFKLVAAFFRSRVLHRNTRWPIRGEGKALERLGEDIANAVAEAESHARFVDANISVFIGDSETVAHIRKMRARLAMFGEGGRNA